MELAERAILEENLLQESVYAKDVDKLPHFRTNLVKQKEFFYFDKILSEKASKKPYLHLLGRQEALEVFLKAQELLYDKSLKLLFFLKANF